MVHNRDPCRAVNRCLFLHRPVTAYPGEFGDGGHEAGAIRVMEGEEELKTYVWNACLGWF